jgi:class 3 adenylate cyclase
MQVMSPYRCRNCEQENQSGAKFCSRCGERLAVAGPFKAERKHVTLLFCDIVESVSLAIALDPEDLAEVHRDYQSLVADIVQRAGGFIARYTGDGVLVYFGWPQAREDDAERAARAALSIVASVRTLSAREQQLQVRIGIATGLVSLGTCSE